MERHRQRLAEGGDLRRHAGRHQQHAIRGQQRLLGEAAVGDLADIAHLQAEIAIAFEAMDAAAAIGPGIRHHQIAGAETLHIGAELGDGGGEFMTRRHRQMGDPHAGAVIVQIGAADARGRGP